MLLKSNSCPSSLVRYDSASFSPGCHFAATKDVGVRPQRRGGQTKRRGGQTKKTWGSDQVSGFFLTGEPGVRPRVDPDQKPETWSDPEPPRTPSRRARYGHRRWASSIRQCVIPHRAALRGERQESLEDAGPI